MWLLNWYRQWKQIRAEFHEDKVCISCESLKQQVEILQHNNNELLQGLLAAGRPSPEPRQNLDNLKPMMPRRLPWAQKRQMLEAEDRHRASLLRDKQKEMNPTPPVASVASTTLEELEQEVGVVDASEERETNTAAAHS